MKAKRGLWGLQGGEAQPADGPLPQSSGGGAPGLTAAQSQALKDYLSQTPQADAVLPQLNALAGGVQ